MTPDVPDLDTLATSVVGSPADRDAIARFAGAVRAHPRLVSEHHAAALVLALRSDVVKQEAMGRSVERLLSQRYADSESGVDTAGDDPLLVEFLARTWVTSQPIEQMVLRLRRLLLDDDHDRLMAALALQAFNNGYLLGGDDTELAAAAAARQRGVGAAEPEVTAREVLRSAMYVALDDRAKAALATLARDTLPEPLRHVLVRLVDEPMEERRLVPLVPSFGRIADHTSLRVQAQYEDHPFPRWITIGGKHRGLDRHFPDGVAPPSQRFGDEPLRVLVPGCGTGQHPLMVALGNPQASVVAVDLSRASLAYAQRKANESGVENLELLHGDLLDIRSLGRTFHHIDCVGVLHHLGDPSAGWRALTDVLEPGGTMHIGVYGKAARLPVTFVRDDVARLGLEPTERDMRAYRSRLLADPAYATILKSVSGAITTMSHLRDTLFHASEHQYSVTEIEETLDSLGLRLLFVELRNQLQRRYEATFDDGPITDFDRWRTFEPAYAGSLQMFTFWVEKVV